MSQCATSDFPWTHVQYDPTVTTLLARDNHAGSSTNPLLVSNPSVPLPLGLWFQKDFVGPEEEQIILDDIKERKYVLEGFEQRRRVQRYSFGVDETGGGDDDDLVPKSLVALRDRLCQLTGLNASHVAVEEYSVSSFLQSRETPSNNRAASFEFGIHSSSNQHECQCFVAQIPLHKAAIQHLNKPRTRSARCWHLETPNHWTDVHMDRGCLLVRTDDCLSHWRSQLTADPTCSESVYILTFSSLCTNFATNHSENGLQQQNQDDMFGYIPSENDHVPLPDEPMPALENLLTIIITTSPIKSNPSTEVIERAMDTFVLGGPDFAYKCRKVIVCDGVRNEGPSVTKRHANTKQALRNGVVTSAQAEHYKQYKANLKALCENASESSPFFNAVVEELDVRQGFGFALRHAVRNCVSTKFVCVVQHDRTFMRPTPVRETVEAMWRHPAIKYVGMSMRSNLMYRDIFLTKYGRKYTDELKELILRVPELSIDKSLYGPNSKSTAEMVYPSEKLRENILSLAANYNSSAHAAMEREWAEQHILNDQGKQQMSLTPTLFWYDNVHISETEHYRDFVFHPPYKMVARGGFVEETLSPVLKRTVELMGLKEGHSRFGCYLLDDHSGMFFTGHLDGGSYLTSAERSNLQAQIGVE